MELLAQIRANLLWHIGKCREIPQMLVTLEEGEQRQLLGISTRMGRDKRPLVVGRAVEGVGKGSLRYDAREATQISAFGSDPGNFLVEWALRPPLRGVFRPTTAGFAYLRKSCARDPQMSHHTGSAVEPMED